MLKNMRMAHQMIIRTSGLVAILMVAAVIVYSHLVRARGDAADVEQNSLPGLYYSTQIANALSMNYLLLEEYLIQGDETGARKIGAELDKSAVELNDIVANYEKRIADDKARKNLDALKSQLASYLSVENENMNIVGGGDIAFDKKAVTERALMMARLRPAFESMRDSLRKLQDVNRDAAGQAARRIQNDIYWVSVYCAAGLVGFLLVFALLIIQTFPNMIWPMERLIAAIDAMRKGDFTQRVDVKNGDEVGRAMDGFNRMADEITALVGHVQKSGIQVNTSMTEIAATSRQQQATASEIAATTTEVGATSKEISATSKELARTMLEISQVAEETAALANSGQGGLTRMEETMGKVMGAASTINSKLAVLNEKAGNINQVVTTITKVADQTNLLSLNAAIEAEKAGEYGRGFAVVAAEIRRLADQTGIATYDIEQMVKEIQSAISAGVMGMDKFSEEVRRGMQDVQQAGAQLSQIIDQVQTLVPRFDTVSEGMQAQATGAEQISEALYQLTEGAQQTVESLRQSTLAIDELSQVSGNLRGSVSRFKLHA
ncbi:MAG TPA: methyl-accepting chemotaxis protein [Parvibaculum sp.]